MGLQVEELGATALRNSAKQWEHSRRTKIRQEKQKFGQMNFPCLFTKLTHAPMVKFGLTQ